VPGRLHVDLDEQPAAGERLGAALVDREGRRSRGVDDLEIAVEDAGAEAVLAESELVLGV
jgi:hypothetical protein